MFSRDVSEMLVSYLSVRAFVKMEKPLGAEGQWGFHPLQRQHSFGLELS